MDRNQPTFVNSKKPDQWALGQLGAAMPIRVQQALIARLDDPEGTVRQAVTSSLGQLGAAMPVGVQQALIARLDDPGGRVCEAASEALGQLGAAMPVGVQQALITGLEHPLREVRQTVSKVVCSVQDRGLRFFPNSTGMSPSRSVSDLATTGPIFDGCSTAFQKSSLFSLADESKFRS